MSRSPAACSSAAYSATARPSGHRGHERRIPPFLLAEVGEERASVHLLEPRPAGPYGIQQSGRRAVVEVSARDHGSPQRAGYTRPQQLAHCGQREQITGELVEHPLGGQTAQHGSQQVGRDARLAGELVGPTRPLGQPIRHLRGDGDVQQLADQVAVGEPGEASA